MTDAVEADVEEREGRSDASPSDGEGRSGASPSKNRPLGLPRFAAALLPLVLLALVLGPFVATTPLSDLQHGEPVPDVTVSHSTLPDEETMVLHVTNDGPESVTVSQVLVDEAYWNYEVRSAGGDRTLEPRESARVVVPYHWEPGWDYHVTLVLSDGATVEHTIEAARGSPGFGFDLLWTLALIGLFVGVVPVALGMLWFPFIRSMGDRWLHAALLFAAGVLCFLAFDAAFEALETAESVPGAFEGELLVVLGVVGALLSVQAIGVWREGRIAERMATDGGAPAGEGTATGESPATDGLWLAYLLAVGVGLHNLAEGLAIGSAFALGRASLGAFLVVGFMLHNVTEGPAVVAPAAREPERPALWHFLALGAVAGLPVILGGWIGSLAYSPVVGAFFLAVGVGAILQVDWEILGMVREQRGRVGSATNLLAFLAGFALMYATDLLVVL
jgi:zinc transporter ZupT